MKTIAIYARKSVERRLFFPVLDKGMDILDLFMVLNIIFQVPQSLVKADPSFLLPGKQGKAGVQSSENQIYHGKTLLKASLTCHFYLLFVVLRERLPSSIRVIP